MSIFSATQLLWLTCALSACLVAALVFQCLGARARRRMLIGCALAAVFSELLRDLLMALHGRFDPSYMLPLHLCGVMLFVELAAVCTKNPLLCELSYCLGMPGAFAALLTPGYSALPFWNLLYLQFILAHSLLFLTPALLRLDGFQPDSRRLPTCFLLLVGYAALVAPINRLLGGNYLFLALPSPGSPLAWLREAFGAFYLPSLAAAVWLAWLALYLPWRRVLALFPARR